MNYDVIVIGGGMIGLTMALGLKQQGRSVMVIEQHEQPALPNELELRVSALNHRSRALLDELGVWPLVSDFRIGPYTDMHVWDKDSPADIHFSATEANADDLGAITENRVLEHFLWQRAEAAGVVITKTAQWRLRDCGSAQQAAEIEYGEQQRAQAQLIIGADGGRSRLRQQAGLTVRFWDYEQVGVVANLRMEKPHNGVARQVFLPTGPLALLPTPDTDVVSIVWSMDSSLAQTRLANKARLAPFVTAESGRCLGEAELISDVKGFPLRMQYAQQWHAQRVVLVGDAAHTIHPLAGQGANLGFADCVCLLENLQQRELADLSSLTRSLGRYQRERKADTQTMIAAMELFKRGFGTSNPWIKAVRSLGLLAAERITPVKQKLAEVALGR